MPGGRPNIVYIMADDHAANAISAYGSRLASVCRMSQWDHPTGRLDVRALDHRERTKAAYQRYLKDYLRTAQGLDDSVGAILEYLDADGIADDTVVIYTSDQGMFL